MGLIPETIFRYNNSMSENAAGASLPDISRDFGALRSEEQVKKISRIQNFTISGDPNRGKSGWVLHGTDDHDRAAAIKLASNPVTETGSHFEHDAQMLKLASERTYFVPIYYGHGLTDVPGVEGKFPYIAMQDINGQTLAEIMKIHEENPHLIDITTTLDILGSVAQGIDELLEGDPPIISRDIKPGNIIIRENEGELKTPVLVDFNLAAKEGASNDIKEGELRGSPNYAGPEMIIPGKEITRDLNSWQLGAVAFEMLTHESLFNLDNPAALYYRYATEEAFNKFLNQRMDAVMLPTATRNVLTKALSYNPVDRYHSAMQFIKELDTAESQYIDHSRRKPGEHLLKKPVKNIIRRATTSGPGHARIDSTRPENRHEPRHARGGKHRRPIGQSNTALDKSPK